MCQAWFDVCEGEGLALEGLWGRKGLAHHHLMEQSSGLQWGPA